MIPDYPLEETLDFKFSSRNTSDVPTTLSGTPAVQVYEDNSVTQITAGITLTVDFDGVTGLNHLRIVATAANGFESGKSYQAVISAGTVGGTSVVGEVVAQFSIERSPALRPTTAGRTLDVTTGGAAGIDWANVENQTTAVNLSGTTIQWNATWDAQVESEVNDGLVAFWTSPGNLVDLIWDEVLTGGTHNVSQSSGRRLRQLQDSGSVYGGFIWIDTVNGTAGTTSYENGTSDNPVDNIADANTLSAALGIPRFRVAPGSSITLATTQSNQEFFGTEWTLALGGQSIAGSHFQGAVVSGTGTGANANFTNCQIGNVTVAGCRMGFCTLTGTLTFSAATDYYLHDCFSGVAGGGTPTIDFGAAVANTNLSLRRYSGGLTITNKDATGTDQMSLEGNGQLVVAASSGGAISVRGNFKVTNTGGATITYDDNTQNTADILADTADLQANQGSWLTATGFATSAALATAQADLDTITGTDGVTLATAQALYAPAKAGDAMTLTAAANLAIADALLKRDMSAVSGEAARSPLNALRILRNKWTIVAGTFTSYKEDDSTTAWTSVVTTDAAADPIDSSDPA